MKNDIYRKIMIFFIVLYKAVMYYPQMNNIALYVIIMLTILVGAMACKGKKFTKKKFSKILLFSILVLLSIANTRSANFIFIFLIVLNFNKNDIRRLLKYFFISIATCMLITIALSSLGILSSNNLIRYAKYGKNINYARTDFASRYSLGFAHPGFVGIYTMFLVTAYYCYSKNIKKFLLTIPLVILMYSLCGSRAMLVAYVFFWVLIIVGKKIQIDKLRKITKHSFLILTVLSVLTAYIYAKYKMTSIDMLFSGRLEHYSVYIENGLLIRPFGSEWISGYTIDNYFLYWFFDFGFIGFIIMLFLTTKSISKIDKKELLFAILSMYLYGLFDSTVAISNINPFISIIFIYLVDDKNTNNLTASTEGAKK